MNSPAFPALTHALRTHFGQEHRYAHCVRVARCADVLAQRHGEKPQRARIAGLLHDVARLSSGPELIERARTAGVPIGPFETRNPVVLHAPVGAVVAGELFGIDDPAIASAIAKHTLGSAEMSKLDTIVYLADALEPGRAFRGRAQLWQLALYDLDAALVATIESGLDDLRARGLPPAPQTLAALRAARERSREASPFAS